MTTEKLFELIAAGCVIAFVTSVGVLFVGMAILAGLAGVG